MTVYVADSLDDTISVIEVESGRLLRTIALGPRPELTPPDRGERFFSDATLSHHGWMSCQSCHTDGHTDGQLADTLGDGSYGAPKLVPTLLGVGDTGPWAWNGSFDRLEEQVRQSIETTMRGASSPGGPVADLVAYLRTLKPPPGQAVAEDAHVERGREVFRDRGCVTCHVAPSYTSPGTYDVELVDEAGHRKFNPPSLRGIFRRDRFLHDGRAESLPDVFRRHHHPRSASMTASEIDDLVHFLKTL
jgi:cytochrome c peroxidase